MQDVRNIVDKSIKNIEMRGMGDVRSEMIKVSIIQYILFFIAGII